MSKKWLYPLVIAGVLVLATGCSQEKEEIVATVGDEKITKEELYDTLVKVSGQQALDMMIEDKVIAMELKKEKVTVSDEEVEAELATQIESTGGDEAFAAALEQGGITEEEFKKSITEYLSIRKVVEPRIKITDEELKAYFDENKETLSTEGEKEAVLEDHKDDIKKLLIEQGMQTEYVDWLDEVKEKYDIENTLLAK